MRTDLLPIAVCVALLRILRNKPPHPEDEDVLFDCFDALGNEQVLGKAAARLLHGGEASRRSTRDRALDAVLVDMLRQHYRFRELERDAA